MTSESLREQVEKRIAELKEENCAMVNNNDIIYELEQVLTLIDGCAKELEAKAFTGKTFDKEKFITIQTALTLLVDNTNNNQKEQQLGEKQA